MVNEASSVKDAFSRLRGYHNRLERATAEGVMDRAKAEQLYYEKLHQMVAPLLKKDGLSSGYSKLLAMGLETGSEEGEEV